MKLLICVITSLFLSLSVHAQIVGKIIFTKGRVVSINGNKENIVKKGHQLKLGETIQTMANALAVIKLNDKSTIKLDSKSKIKVSQIVSKLQPTEVELSIGSAFFNVLRKKQTQKKSEDLEKFKVKTRTAAMAVRGTTFFVAALDKAKSYDTWMCVKEGRVLAMKSKHGKSVLVKTGEGIKIATREKIESPRPLPWTQGLNWELDIEKDITNKVDISNAYKDLLDTEYD